MPEQTPLSIILDVSTLLLSIVAFVVAMRTQRAADRRREEVDGRRPFAAELQKLSGFVIQATVLQNAVSGLRRRLQGMLQKLETTAGLQQNAAIDALQVTLARESTVPEMLTETRRRLDKLWRERKPTDALFADVQQLIANCEGIIQGLQGEEDLILERMKEFSSVDNRSAA